jgi:hypothetical protein
VLRLPLPISPSDAFVQPFSRENLSSPPPGRARSATKIFIVAYLLCQLTLPLVYYFRDDKSDERFTWRMFSAVHFEQNKCGVSLAVWRPGADLLVLSKEEVEAAIPSGWIEFLSRDYAPVGSKFLRRYCEAHPELAEVQLIRLCPATAAGTRPRMNRTGLICRTGKLIRTHESL